MKFVKVIDPIKDISTKEITFKNLMPRGDGGFVESETFLLRKHQGTTQWKLTKDGVMVREEIAKAYHLDFIEEPTECENPEEIGENPDGTAEFMDCGYCRYCMKPVAKQG